MQKKHLLHPVENISLIFPYCPGCIRVNKKQNIKEMAIIVSSYISLFKAKRFTAEPEMMINS